MPSSVIRNYQYNPAERVLAIDFQTGRRYLYLEVPEAEVARMRAVTSKGSYFNRRIRNRYRFREVRPS